MSELEKDDQCRLDVSTADHHREEIPNVVDQLVLSCSREDCFDHVSPEPLPSRASIINIIEQARQILFPGYFMRGRVDRINLRYYYGQIVTGLFDILADQIMLAIRHECLRYDQPCTHCQDRGHEAAIGFVKILPRLRALLGKDVQAAREGDPAARSFDEIIFSYPGLFAIMVYRIAHEFANLDVPLIPRIMTEYAHSQTGIDIHPRAQIGESFFIDHGTGAVIGETTEIGNRVRIYQGVTLGALSLPKDAVEGLRDRKRHPTIEEDVVIYSGATILGGETIIGARSVIGGNVWITESVPKDTRVFLKKPELIYKGNER